MMILDPQHPLLRPLWVRILVTALPFCAAAWFFATGSVAGGAVFTILSGFVFRALFL